MSRDQHEEFERLARQRSAGSSLGDLWHLLRSTRKWWLLPMLVVLLLLGCLVLLSSSAAGPFLYTLF